MRQNTKFLRTVYILVLVFFVFGFITPITEAQKKVTSPKEFFGFELGSDRKIARWDKIVEYFKLLEKESGKGPLLVRTFLLFILFLGAVAFSLLVLKVPLIPFFLGTLSLLVSIFLNSLVFVDGNADLKGS